MSAGFLLWLFFGLHLGKRFFEHCLASVNRRYYRDIDRQREACQRLAIDQDEMDKSLAYAGDRYRLGTIDAWVGELLLLLVIIIGGLGYVEGLAQQLSSAIHGGQPWQLTSGLIFFAILSTLSMIISIPFSYYHTFVIEERHGFNRQTRRGFVADLSKNCLIAIILGAIVLSVILLFIEHGGRYWWLYGWLFVFTFGLLTNWLYPTVLAPLFNKFQPLATGELRDRLFELAERVGFASDQIYVMDASKRSAHGNAYFTGLFGKKRIVLFDTLIEALSTKEIVAVLAHEIGHYKLHHIRWRLIRSFFMVGIMFLLINWAMDKQQLYDAFSLNLSSYGALIVFSLWFAMLGFFVAPFSSYLSRRDEFSADRYARQVVGNSADLKAGLLKLREKSRAVPISHPLYVAIYYSHPPLITRLQALDKM